MKELIIKYIVGEANNQERLLVEAWVAEQSDNKKELEEMKKVWDIGGEFNEVPEINIDKAWSDFVRMRGKGKRYSLNWMHIAASLVLLGAFAFWGLRSFLSVETQLATDLQVQHIGLPDGSTVHLNTHAEMVYRKQWLEKDRKVRLLKGEVFFDVKKDIHHPFVIESGKSKITVLGTSFQVRRDGMDTEVIVASGAVKVGYRGQEVVLKPNQMIVVSDTSDREARIDTVPDQLYRYYVHQEFTFENTPLPRVFEILGKAYQKKFLIEDPRIKALTYTATFEQQDLNEIIDVILKTFSLKISKKDEAYYIN
ncbi:FecR family protein [Sphingobacterium arenae]|uniref:FecR domain-containing protein n=1 Tax=Sphingobacterium arenae TaxID=1280598 RepID=A0ABR7Y0Z8_9SPHI|nr:FecR domain-containing protein [Sphingobacterium arenae]MBD1424982.1 FecR domain-containing protein [Sphingobacterium arenae]